jgi:hypothetical protein
LGHEYQLHQEIMVVLVQLLTRKADILTLYGRQEHVLDEASIFALDAAKER